MTGTLPLREGAFPLDPGWRGVPPNQAGVSSAEAVRQGWFPADGHMALPLLSLDLPVFESNCRAMLAICGRAGALLAPHAKTPMSPVLAGAMVEAGAWGTSVADLRQAGIMLRGGLRRIVLANEIGGRNAVRRLGALLDAHSDAEFYLFVDSTALIEALATEWRDRPTLPPLGLLIEVGCGRGGATTQAEVDALIAACGGLDGSSLRLAGIATYEGTVNRPDAVAVAAALDDLFTRLGMALAAVRRAVGPGYPLLLSAGGSMLFDHVIARCGPIAAADGATQLMLRSGSCYYGDHGAMPGRFASIVARDLLGPESSYQVASFRPALRLWAEVLSFHGRTAICGLGLRDAAHDQGLPVPLRWWRDGSPAGDFGRGAVLTRFNDQHAFVEAEAATLAVGDVVEFGVRHPCTTIDKHDLIYGLGPDGTVCRIIRTFFG